MIAESVNNVFGRTVNPRNRKLTSGGSSGGESALIAFGGSVLGVGTDIVCQTITILRYSFADIGRREGVFVYRQPALESSRSDHRLADSRPKIVAPD